MIDLKQGYFLVIEIERKVRIDMQQLCTIIIITSLLVVIASCIIHHNKGKKVRACADRLLSFVTKVTFVFVNIIYRLVDFRTHFKLEVVV